MRHLAGHTRTEANLAQLTVLASISAKTRLIPAARSARPGASAPDAIGRWHLTGWRRSSSASCTSLMRYVPVASRQKTRKVISNGVTVVGVPLIPAAAGAANTSRFLVHCRMRAARIQTR